MIPIKCLIEHILTIRINCFSSKLFQFLLLKAFFITIPTSAQKIIKGTIQNKEIEVEGIHVINLSKDVATITNQDGFFEILADLNDTIQISGIQFKKHNEIISKKNYKTGWVKLFLEERVFELNEVIVSNLTLTGNLNADLIAFKIPNEINSENIGLPNSNVKLLTKTEREIFSAGKGFSITSLINTITGYKNKLNNRLQIEKEGIKIEKIRNQLGGDYFNRIGIPNHKIYNFLYYCSSKDKFKLIEKSNEIETLAFFEKEAEEYKKQ